MRGEELGRQFLDPLFSPRLNTFLIPAGTTGRMLVGAESDRQAIVHVIDDEQNAANIDKGGIGGTVRLNDFVLDFNFLFSNSFRRGQYNTILETVSTITAIYFQRPSPSEPFSTTRAHTSSPPF